MPLPVHRASSFPCAKITPAQICIDDSTLKCTPEMGSVTLSPFPDNALPGLAMAQRAFRPSSNRPKEDCRNTFLIRIWLRALKIRGRNLPATGFESRASPVQLQLLCEEKSQGTVLAKVDISTCYVFSQLLWPFKINL
jgi:hypothetical protein